ncbi:C39 family peptidase [Kurthia zopfii]|uniref:C39 family peptidase n=1 Tax=Kurthia zopfii TaxID=1650 RepID=UPI000F6B75B6|nr:C39 family peptidase [Kurthia zopfii]VEI06137.1 Uncharacterised protein [Kurthia zopfii]
MSELRLTARNQHDSTVRQSYRASACGPTAVATILDYYEIQNISINQLYNELHCTSIGLPSRFLIHFSKRILGSPWQIQRIKLFQALHEIQCKRPVLLKFDRYFTFKFWRKSYFSYHWTVLVGYEWQRDSLHLIVEDLGTPSRASRRHIIPYKPHEHALTFVQFTPLLVSKK